MARTEFLGIPKNSLATTVEDAVVANFNEFAELVDAKLKDFSEVKTYTASINPTTSGAIDHTRSTIKAISRAGIIVISGYVTLAPTTYGSSLYIGDVVGVNVGGGSSWCQFPVSGYAGVCGEGMLVNQGPDIKVMFAVNEENTGHPLRFLAIAPIA